MAAANAVLGNLIKANGTIQMDPFEHLYRSKRKVRLYDNVQKTWRRMHVYDIPWTYTFAPRPTNYRMEAKLWMFAARRVNHRFIWSRDQIPMRDFSQIKSRSNAENHGRYTFLHF